MNLSSVSVTVEGRMGQWKRLGKTWSLRDAAERERLPSDQTSGICFFSTTYAASEPLHQRLWALYLWILRWLSSAIGGFATAMRRLLPHNLISPTIYHHVPNNSY